MRSKQSKNKFENIPFRIHPRVFAALGADLVTNDVVAVIELVKNSYDAFASNCWIRFHRDNESNLFLEIEDNGQGMSRDVIEDVWAVVATPNKLNNPKTKSGKKTRRVVGEKGLGRLSVSRLGMQLEMVTQSRNDDCWEVGVDWQLLAQGSSLSDCFVSVREFPDESPFENTGTRLRILNLQSAWDEAMIADLEDNLERLISPFAEVSDFKVMLLAPDNDESETIHVESPKFLSRPKYLIRGDVDNEGNVTAGYKFRPIREGKPRQKKINLVWEQIYDSIQDKKRFPFLPENYRCGAFEFEIRGWDIGSDDTQEIADKFDLQKNTIRKAIRGHKGISVYRDDVLVLPKSDDARDWLGLDLRRVSKVGSRMSTSQLVGYVAITAEHNPGIVDTSDRERLVSRIEVAEFQELLKAIVSVMENEREQDREVGKDDDDPMQDLFEQLSAEELIAEVISLAEEGAEASEAVPLLTAFNKSLDKARKTIQDRFVHYSRMATVGTIAQMLVHEIRNRTTSFGEFLELVHSQFGPFDDRKLKTEYRNADEAIDALERLADIFSPLASRSFNRRRRDSILEEQIEKCLELHNSELERKNIETRYPKTKTKVNVDPGELDAVILNLLSNAIFWLSETSKDARVIEFKFSTINDGQRIRVWIHDSGGGIEKEDINKIFQPGVTRKPNGIGMGLTVASEIVSEYGGRMTAKYPGSHGGASFAFDFPIKN
ncbi:sensor histidine kinase [uncultured Gimesia sp.]|uniref:sensor histidine kinase n=1 Tax=uncultured Gimesia sp. TaxID=1678688 RepID=UPI0030D724DC|tara:strand:+ start:71466 stop:73616 length:2151 start_codon:yes stop_codon:yes gene_type:complete